MNYTWEVTGEISLLLNKFNNQKEKIENLRILPQAELGIRTNSILKSSVYSARIEGFTDEIDSPKKASQNLLSAYNLVHSGKLHTVNLENIKLLHQHVLKNMSANVGSFRTEPWAIFDAAGNAIYLAPMHFEVPALMEEFVHFIPKINEHPAIVAAIAQFIFEKIHPFPDGNGRVGRLISALVLVQRGYGLKGLVPFEKYLDLHKSEYYQSLESSNNITQFIHFFLSALTNEIDEIIYSLESATIDTESLLLPRRKEILSIIRDHPMCSFDQIRRRFLAVNPKTLHYDLAQLTKSGYIKKIGATRGALYQSVK